MLCSRNWACSIAPADRKKRVVKMESKHRKDDGFWLAVEWIEMVAGIIAGSFAYSRFHPSYHNPFFNDPVGMAIVAGIPTLFFWWRWWSRRRRM
jgi:hypothetical protein